MKIIKSLFLVFVCFVPSISRAAEKKCLEQDDIYTPKDWQLISFKGNVANKVIFMNLSFIKPNKDRVTAVVISKESEVQFNWYSMRLMSLTVETDARTKTYTRVWGNDPATKVLYPTECFEVLKDHPTE